MDIVIVPMTGRSCRRSLLITAFGLSLSAQLASAGACRDLARQPISLWSPPRTAAAVAVPSGQWQALPKRQSAADCSALWPASNDSSEPDFDPVALQAASCHPAATCDGCAGLIWLGTVAITPKTAHEQCALLCRFRP